MTTATTPDISSRPLVVTSIGTLLALAAFTAPLATITSTAADLGSDTAGTTWILSSMSIGLSAALLVSGALADDVGRRRTFVIGLLLLGVGSVASAVAPNTLVFVVARIVQGIGAGAVIASSLGINAHSYPPGPLRARASGIWGAALGAGITVGPFLSAGLDRLHSWHDAYWVLALAAAVLAAAAHRVVPESRSDTPRGIDVLGAVTLPAGLSAILAALVEGRTGWASPATLILFAVGVALLAAFVLIEWRSSAPMLDLTLLRRPAFLAVTVAALATGAGIIALMSFMAGFLGRTYGLDGWSSACLLFAWSGTSVVTALLARRIPAGITGRVQLAVALLGVAVGQLLMLGMSESSSYVRLVPGLLVAGIASGVLNAALAREAVASVPAGRASMGSGANNTARYLGSAVGVTIVAVVASPVGGGTAALFTGWNHAVLVVAGVSVAGAAVVGATMLGRSD